MKPPQLPLLPEQIEWLKTATPVEPNPCVRTYGLGPEGEQCKNCSHLYASQKGNTYYKCGLRKHTNGPGSDHRVRWNACARFERR